MKTGRKIAFLTIIGMMFVACGSEEKTVLEPDLFSKADFATRVQMKGQLDFGAEATDSFTQDLEYHAYSVYAAANSKVSIEVTQKGTSRDLDTTLFVYGPQLNTGALGDRVAHDDDSGWGPHAKLKELTLTKIGTYTVVVGSADGMGRGNYRLVLKCLSDNQCLSPDTPVEITPVDTPEELDELLANASVPSYAYHRIFAFKWSAGGVETPDYDQVREPVAKWWLNEYEWEDEELPWDDEDELTTGRFDAELSEYEVDLGDFERAAGLSPYDYRIFTAGYEYACYMGVTCWETLYTIISWDSDDLYLLILGAGEE